MPFMLMTVLIVSATASIAAAAVIVAACLTAYAKSALKDYRGSRIRVTRIRRGWSADFTPLQREILKRAGSLLGPPL